MPAYVIFYVEEILDRAKLDRYKAAAHPSILAAGGKVIIAYGRSEWVEGKPLIGVVTVEFPDFDSATGWYRSDAYRAAKALREEAAVCHSVIVEGR